MAALIHAGDDKRCHQEKLTVRFQPRPGSTAGGVFDVRILKAK